MPSNRQPRLAISVKKLLIDLNIAMDAAKTWAAGTQHIDAWSTTFLSWSNDPIPQIATDILILEDRRFFRHQGFDLKSIPRALKRRWQYGRFGGISTIEQQLVRTINQRRERTFRRKYREIVLALLLNLHLSKEEILSSYLNTVYFGPSMHGIDIAAIVIFGRPASQLNSQQSAVIASLLPYPLPSKLSLFLRRTGKCFESADDFLASAEKIYPEWTIRIKRRISYLEDLRPKYSEVVWQGFRR